jgi:hypothetical protein
MRVLLLIGGIFCASTMALADTHEMPAAQAPVAESATVYSHHQTMAHSCHHEYMMVRDRCGFWRTQYVPRPPMRSPGRTYGTSFPFRVRPYIDSSRFPRFQSWTSM